MTSNKSEIVVEKIKIEQGHCYLADMNPTKKSKPGKIRPVIVIQTTDTVDAGTPGVVIVPVTTQLQDGNILRVRLKASKDLLIAKDSDALLDQVHTLDRSLIIKKMGVITPDDLKKIQYGVAFLLGMKV